VEAARPQHPQQNHRSSARRVGASRGGGGGALQWSCVDGNGILAHLGAVIVCRACAGLQGYATHVCATVRSSTQWKLTSRHSPSIQCRAAGGRVTAQQRTDHGGRGCSRRLPADRLLPLCDMGRDEDGSRLGPARALQGQGALRRALRAARQ
jgi:hypothetical protein